MQERIIMLVDLDYFFAQCEELRNPILKDKAVVVCVYSGRTEESGAVSTANYIARGYGVKSGMPIYMAKKKLENTNAVFLPVDNAFYEEVSDKVMKILKEHADRFAQVGIDEAYLDVTQRTNGKYGEAKELAKTVKNELKSQIRLTSSIGIGPNKLIAKIAADEKKPDGLTVVEPEEVEAFLSPLPVGRLIGVGTKTREKMQDLGIHMIGDLAAYDAQKLLATFGKVLGAYFHDASHGIDDDPVEHKTKPESISKISTLKQNSRDPNFILQKTDQLCSEIHGIIINEKLTYKTVGIMTVMSDMSIHTRSRTLENPTNSQELMKKNVKELLEKLLNETELDARRVGVKVSSLSKEQKNQKQLTSFIRKESG